MSLNDTRIEITRPQAEFVMSPHAHPAIYGGLGCIHPETRIWTERGLMRIADISSPIRVLSWNEKSRRFQLSFASSSFIKGREVLKKITTTRGCFFAANSHQVLTKQNVYKKISENPDELMQMIDVRKIESVEILSINNDKLSDFYDIRVDNTNNYVCENGFIHHNSGKSEALIIRLVTLMEQDPGVSVGHYFPSYKPSKTLKTNFGF